MSRWLLLMLLMGGQIATPQQSPPNVRSVASQGHLAGSEYINDYFHVTVEIPTPNTWLKSNTLVADNRAQLVEAVNSEGDFEHRHNFVLIVHSAAIPGLKSTTQFVRSIRHSFEREGFETVSAEVEVKYAGREFVKSVLKRRATKDGHEFYKGICVTRIQGYLFGFWIEASSQQQLDKLMDLKSRLHFQ